MNFTPMKTFIIFLSKGQPQLNSLYAQKLAHRYVDEQKNEKEKQNKLMIKTRTIIKFYILVSLVNHYHLDFFTNQTTEMLRNFYLQFTIFL